MVRLCCSKLWIERLREVFNIGIDVKERYIDKLIYLDKYGNGKKIHIKKELESEKTYTMLPLTRDIIFKSLFINNISYLKDFISATLLTDIKPEDINITILNNEGLKDNYNEFKKIADVFLKINDNILLSIEVNRKKYEYVSLRNSRYISKLMDGEISSDNDYKKLHGIKIIQLNINAYYNENNYTDKILVLYDKVSKTIYSENPVTYLKNIEKYRKMYYNGDKKKETLWFAFLCARTYTEAYKILLELYDEDKAIKLMEEVVNLNSNDALIHGWQDEKLSKYEHYCEIVDAEKEGFEKGHKEGIEQGIEKGIEQGVKKGFGIGENAKEKELISKLSKLNVSIETLATAINKTIPETKKLINE